MRAGRVERTHRAGEKAVLLLGGGGSEGVVADSVRLVQVGRRAGAEALS